MYNNDRLAERNINLTRCNPCYFIWIRNTRSNEPLTTETTAICSVENGSKYIQHKPYLSSESPSRRELRKRKGHKKQEDNNAQSVTRQDAHRNKSGDRGASTQAVKVSGGADVMVISRTCASDEEHPTYHVATLSDISATEDNKPTRSLYSTSALVTRFLSTQTVLHSSFEFQSSRLVLYKSVHLYTACSKKNAGTVFSNGCHWKAIQDNIHSYTKMSTFNV